MLKNEATKGNLAKGQWAQNTLSSISTAKINGKMELKRMDKF